MVVLLCVMFATEPSTFQSIVLNFEVVLSLLMYIQGLSVIHFFGKAKRTKRCNDIADGCGDNYYTSNTYHYLAYLI